MGTGSLPLYTVDQLAAEASLLLVDQGCSLLLRRTQVGRIINVFKLQSTPFNLQFIFDLHVIHLHVATL